MKKIFTLFDTLIDPVFVLNQEKLIIYCNEAGATLAELSQRKIINKMKFKDLFQFNEALDLCTNIDAINDPTPLKEIEFLTLNNNPIKAQFTIQPTNLDTTINEWIIFLHDVTLEERLQKKYHGELEEKEKYIHELKEAKDKLEDYSKTLEKKVEERTVQISSINRTMKALLDSLGQGFLIFNSEGKCLDIFSKACNEIFETDPTKKLIWELLKLPEKEVEGFKKWMLTLFSEMLPFEDLSNLGPAIFNHSGQKNISLSYYPLRDENNLIQAVVLVGTDITSLVAAEKNLKQEKEYAQFIIKLIQRKKQVSQFITEINRLITDLEKCTTNEHTSWDKNSLFSIIHTIKGGAGTYSQIEMVDACHDAEDILSNVEKSFSSQQAILFKQKSKLIRTKFEEFKNSTKEILGSHIVENEKIIEIQEVDFRQSMKFLIQNNESKDFALELETKYLLEPIQNYFYIYQDHVERMALALNKKVNPLDISKNNILVFPGIYDHLFACLIHTFNNSLDHGIEPAEERFELGKNEQATIKVDFKILTSPNPTLNIIISDDGRGISPQKIREKLSKMGINTDNETDPEVIQHIFDEQFSTKESVTQTSGRGVGMQAIKEAAEGLGGTAYVESKLGSGTKIFITVPYIQNNTLKSAA